MQIRHARPDDIDELVRHMANAAEEGWIGRQPPLDTEDMSERFRGTIDSDEDSLFVVDDHGAVVGHGTLQTTRAKGVYTFGMLLAPEARGNGAGRRLLEHLVAEARARGAHKLELEVWVDNGRAISLYATTGFEVEGLRRNHWRRKDGSLRSTLLMARLLAG